MKYFYIFFFFFIQTILVSCSSTTGADDFDWLKKTPDDSQLSSTQKEITQNNAELLAFRDLYSQDSTFINIPAQAIDFYYNALAVILNSDAGKNQEIIQELRVFDYRNLHGIIAQPNSQAPFLEAWKDSVILTGLNEVDNILVENDFAISKIYDWSHNDERTLTFVLDTDTAVNTLRITQLLEETSYFLYAEINGMVGDGGDIIFQKKDMYYEVTFIHSYGDCPSGCIRHDEYSFKLDQNGNVEYMGEI
ncbi:MAG: hypothetical protein WD059_08005 [Balneolaceae bacterium]